MSSPTFSVMTKTMIRLSPTMSCLIFSWKFIVERLLFNDYIAKILISKVPSELWICRNSVPPLAMPYRSLVLHHLKRKLLVPSGISIVIKTDLSAIKNTLSSSGTTLVVSHTWHRLAENKSCCQLQFQNKNPDNLQDNLMSRRDSPGSSEPKQEYY
jgi:hypothetical protein